MARPKKAVENKTADELIQMQADLKKQRESAQEDEIVDTPVDDIPDDETPPDDDELDLSSLEVDDGLEDQPPEDAGLQHKYDVLEGKYRAETKRLSDMLSDTMAEVSDLKSQITQLKKSKSTETEPEDETAEEDLKAQYPALYKGLLAIARKEARSMVKDTDSKVDDVIQQGEKARRLDYYNQLAKIVPAWEKLNAHPVFIRWLKERDEFSGTTRDNLITAAFNRFDYETTAKFFNAFIKEKGIKTRQNIDADEENIAPDTSGRGRPNRPAGTPTFTRAQVAKFYQDRAQGRFNGTDEDARKLESRIMQAVREGKVK